MFLNKSRAWPQSRSSLRLSVRTAGNKPFCRDGWGHNVKGTVNESIQAICKNLIRPEAGHVILENFYY